MPHLRNMAESVKVIVRCRPMNDRENRLNCKPVIDMDNGIRQVVLTKPGGGELPPKLFTFDGVYFTDSTTQLIYEDIAFPLVDGVLEGYNGTIFAYGQTGCGKSYTMTGVVDPPEQSGIIPRAFEHIFEAVTVAEDTKFLLHGSYLEIYNEEIRDLLGRNTKSKLELHEHPEKGVYAGGLTHIPVHTVGEIALLMDKGSKNRSVGATLMNIDSSRSHCIFTINIETCKPGGNPDGSDQLRVGKLNLVDLAGSERQAKTGAIGQRLKEATKINLSLSALGNVISALVDGKATHVPYRDSKLTRLLQDSLGGNTKTLMVACISPADNNYDETLSTLRYANRAKNIKNKPKINEDPKDALLREYQEEIMKLKAMLAGQMPVTEISTLSQSVAPQAAQTDEQLNREKLEEETERIRQEYEAQLAEIKAQYEAEQSSKMKLQEEMAKLRSEYESQLEEAEGRFRVSEINGSAVAEGTSLLVSNSNVVSQPVVLETVVKDSAETQEPVTIATSPSRPSDGDQIPNLSIATTNNLSVPVKGSEALPVFDSPVAVAASVGIPSPDAQLAQADYTSSPQLPDSDRKIPSQLQNEELIHRLQVLNEQMVGGEKAKDEQAKERLQNRRKRADERKEKLLEALADDDTEIMEGIYDSLQDEIKGKTKQVKSVKQKLVATQQEVKDIQSEFQQERDDYLDALRERDRLIQFQEQVIDKILPCLRRDCNYINLDKIRVESEWNDEKQEWDMPALTVSRTSLPASGINPMGPRLTNRPRDKPLSPHSNPNPSEISSQLPRKVVSDGQVPCSPSPPPEEDNFTHRISRASESDYFKSKRAAKLLSESSNYSSGSDSMSPSRTVPPIPSNSVMPNSPLTGKLSGQDLSLMRWPRQLESLPSQNMGNNVVPAIPPPLGNVHQKVERRRSKQLRKLDPIQGQKPPPSL